MSASTENPLQYYNERIREISAKLDRLNRAVRFTWPLRLLTFIGWFTSGLWYIKSEFDGIFLWLTVLFFVLFVVAVIWDRRLVYKQKVLKTRLRLNQDEQQYLAHRFENFDGGEDYMETAPELSSDFDLFGPGSLFQYLNRSVTRVGRNLFAKRLGQPEKEVTLISEKQAAIGELASNPAFIEDFRTLGSLTDAEKGEIENLLQWVKEPGNYPKWVIGAARVWPFFMAGWILMTAWGFLVPSLLFVPIFLAFFLVSHQKRNVGMAHEHLGKSARTLKKYVRLIGLIEETPFDSTLLSRVRKKITGDKNNARHGLRQLFKLMEKFDYRLNLIMGVLLNISLLFDFRMLLALEKWRNANKEKVPDWFDAIARFDALMGYAVFAFNQQERTVYPEVKKGNFSFAARDLRHPLLPAGECVGNDIAFSEKPRVLVVTGANMAGKSTFLRTLAVNLLMGMNGAPVCAAEMSFTPCDIRSSINVRDSLTRHESYFYAELRRLKSITEHVGQEPDTLVVLDEILRGTNSRDKHKGSVGLLEKLIRMNAVVVVATHDLAIGDMEKKYPGIVTNHCFEVELNNDQLVFDYKLKPGVSQKLNASFLMRKMGLVSDED